MRAIVFAGWMLASLGPAAAQEALAELRPTEMGGFAEFGRGLALQGDVALVGAPGENALGTESGAGHALRLALGAWEEEALLVAADGSAGDRFGESVALDADRAVIGAPGHGGGAGAAYVFRREGGIWTQEAKLTAESTGGLGNSVALLGDTALAAAPGAPGALSRIFVFRHDGLGWIEEAELVAPEPIPTQVSSVALVEGTAFVGYSAPSAIHVFVRDDQGTPSVQDDAWSFLEGFPLPALLFKMDALAAQEDRMVVGGFFPFGFPPFLDVGVLVFEQDDGGTPEDPLDDQWIQSAEIGIPPGSTELGNTVALDGDRLLASSAPLGARLYRFDGATWQLEATIATLVPSGLSLSAGHAFVAYFYTAELGFCSGSVQVWNEEGVGAWTLSASLLPEGLLRVGCFGCAVDVSVGMEGVVVAGAQLAETAGAEAGAAYVFRQDADGWTQEARLLPSGLLPGDRFGSSVALDGERTLVGAHQRDGAFVDQGAAYVFRREGGAWVQEAELVAPQPSAFGYFGSAVALAGDAALVGAHADDQGGVDAGAAYVFRFDGATWALEQTLHALVPAPGARFGRALALAPGRALVGAPGEVGMQGACYVFRDEGGAWVQEARLAAADGAPQDHFGRSCALSGERALVGAYRADGPATDMGAAYFFLRDSVSSTWSQEQKLVTTNEFVWNEAWYGASVALHGDVALVGAPNGSTQGGTAYQLLRTSPQNPWIEAAELSEAVSPLYPQKGYPQKGGYAVALDLDTYVVGSPLAFLILSGWEFFGAAFVGSVVAPLTAVPTAISARAGGTQALELDAPQAEALNVYQVLGTFSGTEPGFVLGPWTVTLNPDPYFQIVLHEPVQPFTSAFLGLLDGEGDTAASVVLAPGLATALVGTTVHHACVVYDITLGAFTFASNSVPLLIEP